MKFKSAYKFYVFALWLWAGIYSDGFAQNNLMRTISVERINQQPIGTVLRKISSAGKFTFAYNNLTVPADSIVSVPGYQGNIYTYLNKLLGPDYEFKEVPGYIVLRHAPGKLNLTAEVDNDPGKSVIVKGHVTDFANQHDVNEVSVYEKNLLTSTLTDQHGNFELKLKNAGGAIMLTATKDNYKDTSIFILQEVSVNDKAPKKQYKYYPEDNRHGPAGKGFRYLFVTSKQKIQDLNLGGFFAYSPFQVSMVPGLSSHGLYNGQIIDHLSMNILGGYTAGVKGAEMAGLFNIDRKDVSFLQMAGIFNIVGGNVNGIQLAGVANNALNVTGGVQAAGIVNKVHNFGGLVQVAGLVNGADSAGGLQLAGLINVSKGDARFQFAGIVNVASKVKGVQLATLVNVADSSDYPIGIINFVKNGKKSLSISTDQFLFSHIDFRSGGRVLYGLIGVGYKFSNNPIKYAAQVGLGAHIIGETHFNIDAECVTQIAFSRGNDSYKLNAFKLLPAYKFSKTVKLFAGPTLNVVSYQVNSSLNVPGWQLHQYISGNNIHEIHVGLTGGVQFEW